MVVLLLLFLVVTKGLVTAQMILPSLKNQYNMGHMRGTNYVLNSCLIPFNITEYVNDRDKFSTSLSSVGATSVIIIIVILFLTSLIYYTYLRYKHSCIDNDARNIEIVIHDSTTQPIANTIMRKRIRIRATQ